MFGCHLMSSQVPVDPAADRTTMQFHLHDQIQSTARIDKDVKDRILDLCKTCKTPNQDRVSPQRRRPLGPRRAEGQATGFASAGLPAWRCRFTSGTRLRSCSSCSLSSSSTSRIPTRFAVKTCTSPSSSRSPSTRRADHRPTHHDEGRADTGAIRGATRFSRCVTSLHSQRLGKTTIPWNDSFARCIGRVLCNKACVQYALLSRLLQSGCMPCHRTSLDVLVRRMLCCTSRVVCCDGCADEGAHSQAAALFRSSNAQSLEVHAQRELCGG